MHVPLLLIRTQGLSMSRASSNWIFVSCHVMFDESFPLLQMSMAPMAPFTLDFLVVVDDDASIPSRVRVVNASSPSLLGAMAPAPTRAVHVAHGPMPFSPLHGIVADLITGPLVGFHTLASVMRTLVATSSCSSAPTTSVASIATHVPRVYIVASGATTSSASPLHVVGPTAITCTHCASHMGCFSVALVAPSPQSPSQYAHMMYSHGKVGFAHPMDRLNLHTMPVSPLP